MGNILSLQRQGQLDADITGFGAMDDLNYTYNNGNQLQQVDDFSNNLEGFNDGNPGIDYTYDPNGNLTSDANKGITHITYNHLNLPIDIEFNGSSSQTIHYTYDATGVKLKKEIPGKETEYAGNFVYEKFGTGANELQFFNHPEGYVSYDGGQFNYVYNYVDHLGNVRLSYSDTNGDGQIRPEDNEILDEKNYYPFGGEHKGYNSNINGTYHPYGFNGKEENDELGLNTLDFGARSYDKWLGRWMTIDPMADKMRSNSPYNYAFNNPVLFVDPDGMFPIVIHVRSFAPFKSFGPLSAWKGDDRGFSTSSNVTSRLHQISNYETDTGAFSHEARGAFSSSSYGAWAYSDAYLDNYSSGNNLNTHMYGNNDAVFPGGVPPGNIIPYDGGPTWDIDVHTNLDINVSDLDGGNQLLSITGQISGDKFPNAEAYVSDAKGNSVFLGVFATQSGSVIGPTWTLKGDKNQLMMNINMGIVTDKDGIFTGVKVGDNTISIDEWNKNSSGPMSVEEFKKKYGDYYNQLFGDK